MHFLYNIIVKSIIYKQSKFKNYSPHLFFSFFLPKAIYYNKTKVLYIPHNYYIQNIFNNKNIITGGGVSNTINPWLLI